jgi:hypothetical protein
MIGFPEAGLFLQDDLPAQARLVDLHEEPAEQLVIVVNGKPVMVVVIGFVQYFLFSGHAEDIAAIGHVLYLCYRHGMYEGRPRTPCLVIFSGRYCFNSTNLTGKSERSDRKKTAAGLRIRENEL